MATKNLMSSSSFCRRMIPVQPQACHAWRQMTVAQAAVPWAANPGSVLIIKSATNASLRVRSTAAPKTHSAAAVAVVPMSAPRMVQTALVTKSITTLGSSLSSMSYCHCSS